MRRKCGENVASLHSEVYFPSHRCSIYIWNLTDMNITKMLENVRLRVQLNIEILCILEIENGKFNENSYNRPSQLSWRSHHKKRLPQLSWRSYYYILKKRYWSISSLTEIKTIIHFALSRFVWENLIYRDFIARVINVTK